MKQALLIAAMAFSSSAALADFVQIQPVFFQGSSMSIPAEKTCIQDGLIFHKTKTALPVTAPKQSSGDDTVLVMKSIVPQPVVSTFVKSVDCGKDKEATCKKVPYLLNQSTRQIRKYAGSVNDREEGGYTVVGTYNIPACSAPAPVPAN